MASDCWSRLAPALTLPDLVATFAHTRQVPERTREFLSTMETIMQITRKLRLQHARDMWQSTIGKEKECATRGDERRRLAARTLTR